MYSGIFGGGTWEWGYGWVILRRCGRECGDRRVWIVCVCIAVQNHASREKENDTHPSSRPSNSRTPPSSLRVHRACPCPSSYTTSTNLATQISHPPPRHRKPQSILTLHPRIRNPSHPPTSTPSITHTLTCCPNFSASLYNSA